MAETRSKSEPQIEEMHKRTITLADGRYMIFYEFGEVAADDTTDPGESMENDANV